MNLYNQYFEGIFWLPKNDKHKIIGTLFIDNEGSAIISSLQKLENHTNINEWKSIDLVLGHLNSQKDAKTFSVKLYDAYKIFESHSSLNKLKYKSDNTLITTVFDRNIDNHSFNILMLNSKLIERWVPINGFSFKSEVNNKYEISHLYNQPNVISLYKNNDFDIYLFFRATSNLQFRRKSTITENVFVNVKTSKKIGFHEVPEIKKSIERLFNLILSRPFLFTAVELQSTENINYKFIKKTNELFSYIGKPIDFEMFLKNSSQIFQNWFKKQNKLELAITNFFSVYGQKGVLAENMFVTYISILENYHKNYIKSREILKSRLTSLIKKSCLNDKINDINDFAEKLKITRNYHAHLEEKHKQKSFKNYQIIKANDLLEFMILEILHFEIGISNYVDIPTNVSDFIGELNSKKQT